MPPRPYSSTSEVLIEFLDPDGKLLETYSIDATEAITPTFGKTVSQNRTEVGSDRADNTRRTPRQLSITGFMSDAPMNATGPYDPYDARAFKDPSDKSFTVQEGPDQGLYNGSYTGPNQVRMDRALQQAAETEQLVNIDAGPVKGYFERMTITSYSPGWNNQDGQSMPFTLQLQEILTETTEKKQLPQAEETYLDPKIPVRLRTKPGEDTMKLEGMTRRGDIAPRLEGPEMADYSKEIAFYQHEPIDETAPGVYAVTKGLQAIGL